MPAGSGRSSMNKARGPTSRRNAIVGSRICFSPHLYRARNRIERFFNKIKHCRRIATRYDKLAPATWRLSSWHRSAFGCALYEFTT
jgi:transposase